MFLPRLAGLFGLLLATSLLAAAEPSPLPKDDGYRGIWYSNQPQKDEYVYKWEIRGTITSDNNYDVGCLHVESDELWRIIGPSEPGPQPYNTGGEVVLWTSTDRGASWKKEKQLTHDSPYNHTYCRKPLNAQPDFYALWADGHARKVSDSRLYFCDRDGNVFRLPPKMTGKRAKPEWISK